MNDESKEERLGPDAEQAGASPPAEEAVRPGEASEAAEVPVGREGVPAAPPEEESWKAPDFLETAEDKWRYLAEQYGLEPELLLETLLQAAEDERRRELLEQTQGDQETAARLFQQGTERFRAKWEQDRQEEEERERQRLHHRLAADFEILRRQMPQVREPEQLPDNVWRTAVQEGIPLMDAYLRFLWREEQKARLERSREERAAAASSGSLAGTPDLPGSEQNAFVRAFREAVR